MNLQSGNPPFYANIEWAGAKKWDFVDVPLSEVGGDSGIALVLEYAKKQHATLEYLEYPTHVRFYVVELGKRHGESEAFKEFAFSIFDSFFKGIPECDPMPLGRLRQHTKNVSFSKMKKVLAALIEDGHIVKVVMHPVGRGRPSIGFFDPKA